MENPNRWYKTPIRLTRRVPSSARQVWRLLTDTRYWPRWGPSVSAVDLPERIIRLGSTGRVQVLGTLWLPFVVNRFDSGIYWAWQVAGVPATGHRVDDVNGHCCLLSFDVPLWAAPYTLICLLAIKRIQRLVGMPLTQLPNDS